MQILKIFFSRWYPGTALVPTARHNSVHCTMKWLFVLCSASLVLIFSSCSNKFAHIADETIRHDFELQEVERSYLVHLPANYDPQKNYPLILALHGIFSTAEDIAQYSNFNQTADEKEFIVCYPQGYKQSWSIGIKVGPAPRAGIDDIQFFNQLLDSLFNDYSVDTSKVFFTGISNGGFMISSLANQCSHRFSGMALVSSNMLAPIEDYVNDTKPMKVLLIGGTDDPVLAYEGQKFRVKYAFSGFPRALSYWEHRNGYSALPDSSVIDNVPDDKTTVIHYYDASPPNANKLELYKIVGGGHPWPGRKRNFRSLFLGKVSHEIKAAEVIADFFLTE